jgi:hypothetical protein
VDRLQMIIEDMRIACWITKATNTLTEYVVLLAIRGNSDYSIAHDCYVYHCLLLTLKTEV